jgi:RNA polymerase sigma factor (sigma-70 family)
MGASMNLDGPAEPTPLDEHQLVRGLEPFDAFYRRERRSLVGLAYVLSGSRMAAEDLAQEAFTAAYRRWDEVGRFDNPGAWVRRVVANRSVSRFRRSLAELRTLARLVTRQQPGRLPELEAEAAELWAEVGRLSARQRQVVALHYLDGMTMPDIADLLGCSKDTVNTHLRRARQILARRLGIEEGR